LALAFAEQKAGIPLPRVRKNPARVEYCRGFQELTGNTKDILGIALSRFSLGIQRLFRWC
jgi:hypothetical protein